MLRLAFALIVLASPAFAGAWIGKAHVVSGDTIIMEGTTLRLRGIKVPDLNQTCTNAAGTEFECGQAAMLFLQGTIRDRFVECSGGDRNAAILWLVKCWVWLEQGKEPARIDPAVAMVRSGWAKSTEPPQPLHRWGPPQQR